MNVFDKNRRALCTIDALSFSFASSDQLFFDQLQGSFKQRELNFLRGANGVGKSTLLRIMQGNSEPHEKVQGVMRVQGEEYDLACAADRERLSARVKMVQQKFDLMLADQFTPRENLRCAALDTYPSLTFLSDAVRILPLVDTQFFNTKQPVSALSGGQRQIVAIHMALQKEPHILLLDEPTAALDEGNSQLVMQFLEQLVQTMPIIVVIVTHDRELIDRYALQGYQELIFDTRKGTRTLHSRPRNGRGK